MVRARVRLRTLAGSGVNGGKAGAGKLGGDLSSTAQMITPSSGGPPGPPPLGGGALPATHLNDEPAVIARPWRGPQPAPAALHGTGAPPRAPHSPVYSVGDPSTRTPLVASVAK